MKMTSNSNIKTANLLVCRICREAVSINYVSLQRKSWCNLFQYCFNIQVSQQDVCQIICRECASKMKQYATFKKQCSKSEAFWNSLSLETKCCIEKLTPHCVEYSTEFTVEHIEKFFKDDEFEVTFKSDYHDDVSNDINYEMNFDNNNEIIKKETKATSSKNKKGAILLKAGENNIAEIALQTYVKEELLENDSVTSNSLQNINVLNVTAVKEHVTIKEEDAVSENYIIYDKKQGKTKCGVCNKEFKRRYRSLQVHLKNEHNIEVVRNVKPPLPMSPEFYCGICDYVCQSQNNLKQHIIDEHSSKNDLTCKMCDFKGRDFADMVAHRLSHQPKEYKLKLTCHLCDKRFLKDMSFQFHYRSKHMNLKGGLCRYCSRTFLRYRSWWRHECSHRSCKYICDHCGKKFYFRNGIQDHMMIHNTIKPLMCDKCGKTFTKRYNLEQHYLVHLDFKPVVCTHCNKTFKSEYTLADHMKRVNQEKPFKCDVCSKNFATEKLLKKHAFWHSGEQPFQCNICGSKLKAKGHFNTHMKKHTGDLPHKCTECNKAFSTGVQLRRHMSVHTGIKAVKCPYCEKSFHTKKIMYEHCVSKHKEIEVQFSGR